MISKPSAAIPPYHSVWGAEEIWLRLSSQSYLENFQSRRKRSQSTIEPVG